MPRTARLLLSLALLSGAARAADDEVRFKPKAYTGRRLEDRPYRAAVYAPAENARPVGEPLKKGPGRFWRLFTGGGGETGGQLPDPAQTADAPYEQRTHTRVPAVSADPGVVPEKKPFDDSGKRLADPAYQAPDQPAEKNPLLRPRQGIKEPE